jgi:hypothetical protein
MIDILASTLPFKVCEPVVLSHLYINAVFLPRQARDEHRENSMKTLRLLGSQVEVVPEDSVLHFDELWVPGAKNATFCAVHV